jgi:hypothetical protein
MTDKELWEKSQVWESSDDGRGGLKLLESVEKLIALTRADEREACAKVCDDKHDTWRWDDEADSASGPRDCAAAIRARGQA